MPDARFASSRARTLAAELDVDADAITGTGREGRITVADVRGASEAEGRLGDAGRALGRAVRAAVPDGFELDEREAAILDLAARQADDLARLEGAVEREGALSVGSKGQPVVNPAITEARLARLAIGRLLGSLDLPDPAGRTGTEASRRAQRAARQRWAGRGSLDHEEVA